MKVRTTPIERKKCATCGKNLAGTHGKTKLGFKKWKRECTTCCRHRKNQSSLTHRRYLGKVCSACGFVPIHITQLEIHHINENNKDNRVENLITLCANCHTLRHAGIVVNPIKQNDTPKRSPLDKATRVDCTIRPAGVLPDKVSAASKREVVSVNAPAVKPQDNKTSYTPPMDIKFKDLKDIYKPSVTVPQDNIELKREFFEKCSKTKGNPDYGFFDDGDWAIDERLVWEWIEPHLKDDNKIRREDFDRFLDYVSHEDDSEDLIFITQLVEEYLKKEESE